MEDQFYEFSGQYGAPIVRKPHAGRLRTHHALLLAVMTVVFIIFSLKMRYEYAYERMADTMSMLVMVFPVLIVLAVHWLSSSSSSVAKHNNSYQEEYNNRYQEEYNNSYQVEHSPSFSQNSGNGNRNSSGRGNSPWAVGLLVVFLIVLISYQSDDQDRAWFPMRRTRRRYYRY